MSDMVIYEAEGGAVSVKLDGETVWLTQRQLAELLDTSPENILMHLRNIFRDEELDAEATAKDFLAVRTEGKRQVQRQIKHYNLDAIISVAYRVNSRRGVQFRLWATRLLKEHLTRGYTLNRERFEANARELEAALELVRKAACSPELAADSGRGLVEIVSRYTQTFLWLQRYDEGLLTDPAGSPGGLLPSLEQARSALSQLKSQLLARHEATDLASEA